MTRTLRRPLRVAVSSVCLLSLLACLGAGWLWWHAGRVWNEQVEVSALGAYLLVNAAQSEESGRSQWSVLVVRGWPGHAELRVGSRHKRSDPYCGYDIRPPPRSEIRTWDVLGLHADSGQVRLNTCPDGSPLRYELPEFGPVRYELPSADAKSWEINQVTLPYWRLHHAPFWPIVGLTVLPPLLWSVVRVRRAIVRRRRRRMGLCLGCGYDLRESEGRCSECGEPFIATETA